MQQAGGLEFWGQELGGHREGGEDKAVDAESHSDGVQFAFRKITLASGHT